MVTTRLDSGQGQLSQPQAICEFSYGMLQIGAAQYFHYYHGEALRKQDRYISLDVML